MNTAHEYALVYPDTVCHVQSILTPDDFALLISRAFDLVCVLQAPVPDLEIWRQQDGQWVPLLCAADAKPMACLTSKKDTRLLETQSRHLKLGSQVIRLYRRWTLRLRRLRQPSGDSAIKGDAAAIAAIAVLTDKMALVDQLIRSFPNPQGEQVFTYTVLRGYSPEKVAQSMHYSESTIHRMWRRLKIHIGSELMSTLSDDQLRDLRIEIDHELTLPLVKTRGIHGGSRRD